MQSLLELLADRAAFARAPDDDCARGALTLAQRLGRDFAAGERVGRARLLTVTHGPTGLALAAVPGGAFTMGLSRADVEDMRVYVHPDSDWGRAVVERLEREARPAHRVTMRPFLCAVRPITHAIASALVGDFAERGAPLLSYGASGPDVLVMLTATEARRSVDALGQALHSARLMSEAELEYVMRDGGEGRWAGRWNRRSAAEDGAPVDVGSLGLGGLGYGEWVADGWHDGYRRAPRDGSAWSPPHEPQVYRAPGGSWSPWQSDHEVLFCHAAWRGLAGRDEREGRFLVRPALDIPLDG